MSSGVTAALIAAGASATGSVLTFIVGIRSLRKHVTTSNGTPLGELIEARFDRMEERFARLEDSLADVRERLAFEQGRAYPGAWPSHGRR